MSKLYLHFHPFCTSFKVPDERAYKTAASAMEKKKEGENELFFSFLYNSISTLQGKCVTGKKCQGFITFCAKHPSNLIFSEAVHVLSGVGL